MQICGAAFLVFFLTGHLSLASSFTGPPYMSVESGKLRLVGWARLRGELMLYDSLESLMKRAKSPFCISGVFADQQSKDLSKFDNKKVEVIGELKEYSKLDKESGIRSTIIPRKILSGSVVPNFCFGDKVILLGSRPINRIPESAEA